MNRYYYAPKDDPFHRDRWEELYTEEALADLAALADYTAARQMDFVYCLAPGLTIEFSGEAQFMRLMEKFRQVYSVGVRHFGLLLDDIPAELLHETDRVRFGEAVNAHIFLLRRCFAALKAMEPSVRFIVCPMEYHGRGNEYYISRLGQALSGEIELFWTGRNICSQELLEEDAVRFAQHTLHPPLYWDNFPVNDAEMLHEMHLGPLEGREPGLYRHCRGLALNGMEYFECTKVAFLTAARYLWSPEDYDPQMAWLWALEELLGKESAARFLPFAEQLLTSCLKVQNGPRMAAAIDRAAALFRAGNPAAALETLEALMLWMEDCRAFLAQGGHPMLAELGKWIRKYNQCCDVLRQVILVLKAPKKTALRSCLEEKLEEYNENAAVLTEFGFRAFCEKVLEYVS
jgi:hyaluronoglucosaminidase